MDDERLNGAARELRTFGRTMPVTEVDPGALRLQQAFFAVCPVRIKFTIGFIQLLEVLAYAGPQRVQFRIRLFPVLEGTHVHALLGQVVGL